VLIKCSWIVNNVKNELDPSSQQKKDNSKLIDFVLAFPFLLLEQGSNEMISFCSQPAMRWMAIPALLMAIILSNSFKGENITNLIAPRAVVQYGNFSQLIQDGFSLYGSKEEGGGLINITLFDLYFKTKFGEVYVRELPKNLQNNLNITHMSFDIDEVTQIRSGFNSFKFMQKLKAKSFKESVGLATLAKCNNTAIVDYDTKLEVFALGIKYLNPTANLQVGMESLMERRVGIRFRLFVDQRIPKRVRILYESGISPWLISIESNLKQRNRNRGKKRSKINSEEDSGPKKISLDSGVLALFIVTGTFIFISLVIYLYEYLENLLKFKASSRSVSYSCVVSWFIVCSSKLRRSLRKKSIRKAVKKN
jgi:hypothetical protein